MRRLALAGDMGSVDPTHSSALTAMAGSLGAIIGAFGLWIASRMMGKAAFQTAMNDGFAKLMAAQASVNEELQRTMAADRLALSTERLAWAGERASLKGEIRNLMQALDSLKSELRRHGIAIPEGRFADRAPEAGATIITTPKEQP